MGYRNVALLAVSIESENWKLVCGAMRGNHSPLQIRTWKFTVSWWYRSSLLEMEKCQVGLWRDVQGSWTLTGICQMGDWPSPRHAKG